MCVYLYTYIGFAIRNIEFFEISSFSTKVFRNNNHFVSVTHCSEHVFITI